MATIEGSENITIELTREQAQKVLYVLRCREDGARGLAKEHPERPEFKSIEDSMHFLKMHIARQLPEAVR